MSPNWPVIGLSTLALGSGVLIGLGGSELAGLFSRKVRRCRAHFEALHRFEETGRAVVAESLVCCVLIAVAGWFVGGGVFALPGAVFGYMLPELRLEGRVRKRHELIEQQLDDAMGALVNSLKAGLTFIQAIEECSRQKVLPKPIVEEFDIMVREYTLGCTLPEVLESAKARFRSRDFNLICSAILISLERGGNITETLIRITGFMREVNRLKETLNVKTAQGRLASTVMRWVPMWMLGVLYLVDPAAVKLLFNTVFGNLILMAAVLLNVVGHLWTRRIIETEI